jgi:hypothetical protein
MKGMQVRQEVVKHETRDSLLLLALTAFDSGGAAGVGLLAIWTLA